MSWHFSQALVEAYSRAAFSAGELSAQWRSTNSADQSCSSDSVMVLSISSRSGTIYEPSPEQLGEDVLTLFLADFPVRTSAEPAREPDAGARHRRERVFIVADRDGFMGTPGPWAEREFRQPANERFCNGLNAPDSLALWLEMADARAGMDDDVAHRVVRTHAIGNGQVPSVAAGAWRMLAGSQSAKEAK
jgi:hypothetical protein